MQYKKRDRYLKHFGKVQTIIIIGDKETFGITFLLNGFTLTIEECNFQKDLERHKYREECKLCLFNVDVLKSNSKQIKIDELQDEHY